MGHPVSVRLDVDMQSTLEDAAKARGIGLSTYLRELAANEAKRQLQELFEQSQHLAPLPPIRRPNAPPGRQD